MASGYQIQLLMGDEQILGYFVGMLGVDEVHLLNLTVAPAFQRQGLVALCCWTHWPCGPAARAHSGCGWKFGPAICARHVCTSQRLSARGRTSAITLHHHRARRCRGDEPHMACASTPASRPCCCRKWASASGRPHACSPPAAAGATPPRGAQRLWRAPSPPHGPLRLGRRHRRSPPNDRGTGAVLQEPAPALPLRQIRQTPAGLGACWLIVTGQAGPW